MFLELEKQLVFYGAYHHDPVNVAIHVVCVPILLATALTMATRITPFDMPALDNAILPPNLGNILACVYSFLYILMEPVAGALVAPIIVGASAYGTRAMTTFGTSSTTTAALAIHVVAWIAQFVGHGVYEGRAPALLDNLVQAVFLAPFFVWFEILFAFGYRPDLKNRIDVAIEKERAKFRAEKEKKHSPDGRS